MRRYVLTRSVYGPAWPTDANRRRLELTRAVTAASMAAQDVDFTWVVLVDPADELLEQRRAVFQAAAPRVVFLPFAGAGAPDDVAFRAYRAPWRDALGPSDEIMLQTRLDDDDALSPDGLRRMSVPAALYKPRRLVLMLPIGVRVWDGRWTTIRHMRNAMQTLVTPPGDDLCVYDYPHTRPRRAAPVVPVSRTWGWLWVRHRDTLSGWRSAETPIDESVRRAFPVDWRALEASWA